jgi:hypothetical protein
LFTYLSRVSSTLNSVFPFLPPLTVTGPLHSELQMAAQVCSKAHSP